VTGDKCGLTTENQKQIPNTTQILCLGICWQDCESRVVRLLGSAAAGVNAIKTILKTLAIDFCFLRF